MVRLLSVKLQNFRKFIEQLRIFIDEWVKYAKTISVDLFNIIKSIKIRGTIQYYDARFGRRRILLAKDGLFGSKPQK